MKKLTIGVCNYNNDAFLGVLLGEISQQCRCDNLFNLIDVVVYDDCSTSDESKKILNQYKDVFKVVFAEENSGGPARGRNYILEHATSEYIFFVDVDDMILGNIKNILEELEVENDIYVSDLQRISSDGQLRPSTMICSWTLFHRNVKEEDIKKLVTNQTGIWSIYNVKFLKENNIRYLENFRYEDNILFFTVLMQNPRLGLLKVFTLLPINQKKIFFMSQYANYNDNSKHLYLQMKNDPKYRDYKFVLIHGITRGYINVKARNGPSYGMVSI